MKGFRQLKYMSDLKKLIGNYNPRKHSKGFLHSRLVAYIKTLSSDKIDEFVNVAIKNQFVLGSFNPFSVKSVTFLDPNQEYELPSSLILQSFTVFCSTHEAEINTFYRYKGQLESQIIKGEFDSALTLLNEIEGIYGKNIWSIDIRMNIYSRSKYEKEAKLYSDSLSKDENISHISILIYRKHYSTSVSSFYNQVLKNLLIEYRSNGLNRYADYVSVLLVPEYIDAAVDTNEMIKFSQRLSPIDKLLFLNKLSVRNLSSEQVYAPLAIFSSEISKYIHFGGWSNISKYLNEEIEPRIDQGTIDVIKLYSSGDYDNALNACEELVNFDHSNLSILDLYARSVIFADKIDVVENHTKNASNINSQLLATLVHALSLNSDYELQASFFESIFFKYINFDFITPIKPMFYAIYPHKNKSRLKKACIELYCSDHQITPKYLNFLTKRIIPFKLLDSFVDESNLTKSRFLRLEIEKLLKEGPVKEKDKEINFLLDELKEQKDLLKSEYWNLWYKAKILTEQVEDIIHNVVDLLIDSDDNQYFFPLKDIVEILERNREDFTNNIYAVVLYYKYFTLQNFDAKESMSEFFEDYLACNDVGLASELVNSWTSTNKVQEYFLKYVCSTEVMSILLEISSNEELLFERLKVLQETLNLTEGNADFVASEEFSLYEKLYIDILSLEHSNNKIDIDINGIKKSKFSEYESFFELFEEFSHEVPEDLKALFQVNDEDGLSKVDNAILHFYGRAYDSVLNDFIFNDDFGLVRFLSSEIRHGWLPNQIRSVLESHNLVTELGAEKTYEQNEYWHKAYELTVTDSFLNSMDEIFAWFSEHVDKLINTANSWPEVTRDNSDRKVAFNFSYDIDTLKDFKKFTKPAQSSDEFFDLCTEFIWQKLDDCFRIIRALINKELKPEFNKLFAELNNKMSSLGVELNLLNNEISEAQNNTIEEIGIIEGWFSRPEFRNKDNVNIEDIIKVAIANTKGIYNPRDIIIIPKDNCFSLEVESNKMLSLIRALVTTFQNSLKYGVRENGIDIEIEFIDTEKGQELIVVNNITAGVYTDAKNKNIKQKVDEYKQENKQDLLTTEGGTGLYKVFRFVKDYSSESTFKINLDTNRFSQVITLR